MTQTENFGFPYMGSKSKLANRIVSLPPRNQETR